MKGIARLGPLPTTLAITFGWLILHLSPAQAQLTNQILRARGAWPGYARPSLGASLQIDGDKIYLAGGTGELVILDLPGTDKPQRIGSAATRILAEAVHVVEEQDCLCRGVGCRVPGHRCG